MTERDDITTAPDGRERSGLEQRVRASRDADELRTLYRRAIEADDFYARRAVAAHTRSDAELVDECADDPHPLVVTSAVANRNVAPDTIERVLGIEGDIRYPEIRRGHRWVDVALAAAWSASLSSAARRHLGTRPEVIVRAVIAGRPDLSDKELVKLSDDDDDTVAAVAAFALSRDPERLPDVLAALLDDESDAVRRAAEGAPPYRGTRHYRNINRLLGGFVLRRPRPAAVKALGHSPIEVEQQSQLARNMYETRNSKVISALISDALRVLDFDALRNAARHRRTASEDLDRLADVVDIRTIVDVARNPRTREDTLDRILAADHPGQLPPRFVELCRAAQTVEDYDIVGEGWRQLQIAAARHVNLSPRLRRQLTRLGYNGDLRVLRELSARNDLSDEELVHFGRDYPAGVRIRVAARLFEDPVRLPELLQELRDDTNAHVRGTAVGKSREQILKEVEEAEISEAVRPPDGLHTPTDGSAPNFS